MAKGHSPLDQFIIKPLIDLPPLYGYNVDFTNSSAVMVLATLSVIFFLTLGMRGRALIPSKLQSVTELTYQFIASTVKDNCGNEGRQYFPFIFTLFMFVLFCNLFGMIPYSFTATSHIIVTFALSMVVFIGVILIALARHGLHFFSFFLPAGTPWWMAPMMVIIELLSFVSRPVSLAIRLAANMMAGHIMLKIVAGFVIMLGAVFGLLPLALLIIFTGFEIGIAVLHAYIFTVLTCVYLNDAIHLH
jgi:F-type H+-transporting ATPase subunit a